MPRLGYIRAMTSASSLSGKTFVVTGANTGIGKVTAEALAERGAHVVLACRSEDKTKPVVDGIRRTHGESSARFLSLDLGDLGSVRRAADTLLDEGKPIDVLVNNAGLAGLRGLTKDGFEVAFGTNHLGHFLLTTKLLPLIEKAPAPRIVHVSSKSHYDAKPIDWDALQKTTRSTTGMPEYSISKLANVLFASESAKRLPAHVKSYSLHPGVIASDVWRQVPWPVRGLMKMFMLTNEEGARTTLYCATDEAVKEDNGLYYDTQKPKKPSRLAQDPDLAKQLWQRSEEWTAS